MILASLIAAAPIATAVDAERAFARDSQAIGQWSAFRKYADETAVMFTPQAGRYTFECSNLCGAGHEFMRGVIVASE